MNPRTLRVDSAESAAKVREVYKALDARPINRNCVQLSGCCHFKLTGRTPYLTKGEALVAAKAWRASGRKYLPEVTNGSCPMLDTKTARCLIYQDRPFGCRTHFCDTAGGPLARREVINFIHELERIDTELQGVGPRQLRGAVRDALIELG